MLHVSLSKDGEKGLDGGGMGRIGSCAGGEGAQREGMMGIIYFSV